MCLKESSPKDSEKWSSPADTAKKNKKRIGAAETEAAEEARCGGGGGNRGSYGNHGFNFKSVVYGFHVLLFITLGQIGSGIIHAVQADTSLSSVALPPLSPSPLLPFTLKTRGQGGRGQLVQQTVFSEGHHSRRSKRGGGDQSPEVLVKSGLRTTTTTTKKPKTRGSPNSKLDKKDTLDDIFEEFAEDSEPNKRVKRPKARLEGGGGAKIDVLANEANEEEELNLPYHEISTIELEDEENDEKLYKDMLSSLQQWQEHKVREDRRRKAKNFRSKRDEEVVCYGDLGCFRDEGPFDYLDMLPSPPEEVQTQFFLYTRKNREISQLIAYNNYSSLAESNFNSTLPLKIIIHGFGSGCNRVWPREMRISFLAVENVNVLCVDWGPGAADPNYVRAAVNTRLVGKQISILLRTIQENNVDKNVDALTHMIGFSLGAHVAGFAGSERKNLSRITGLDPAGPLFEGYDVKVRLDKTDAHYVDVIHSNGESLIVGGFGVWEPIGHVDFYPNGGRAQRGCQHLLIGGLYDFIYSYSSNNETYRYLCNHRRAYKLFTNSISPKCQFTGFPCDSYEKFETGACFSCKSNLGDCGKLGYYSNQAPGRGSLYLVTRDEEPFCGSQYKINVMFTSSRIPLYTYGRLQLLLVDKDGLNETHPITEDVDDLLTSGSQIEKLLVVHPAIVPVEAHILYVAYDGWIYSGRFQWSLDKLILTDVEGNKKSFCKENGQYLPSGIPVKLKLKEQDCIASSLKAPPDYPIAPFRKYPKKPYDHIPPRLPGHSYSVHGNSHRHPYPEHKLKTSSGQDVFNFKDHVSNQGKIPVIVNKGKHPPTTATQPSINGPTLLSGKPSAPKPVIALISDDKTKTAVKKPQLNSATATQASNENIDANEGVPITINDEVAPKSVPALSFILNSGQKPEPTIEKVKKKGPPYRVDGGIYTSHLQIQPKVGGNTRHQTIHSLKLPISPGGYYPHPQQVSRWTKHPHYSGYPQFLGGTGGPWNIATSRPGTLPPPVHTYSSSLSKRPSHPSIPESGVSVKFGPHFPILNHQGHNQFPGRRRPSTKFNPRIPKPLPPRRMIKPSHAKVTNIQLANSDMSISGSEAAMSFTSGVMQRVPYEKSDNIENITLIGDVDGLKPINNDTSDEVKMQLVSDDQLTIVKIGTEDDIESSNNNETVHNLASNNGTVNETSKVNYIVLHKLPNGEALNLENLKTYNMADIESGKVPQDKSGSSDRVKNGAMGMYKTPRDAPRAYDTIGVNEGYDGLRPDRFSPQRIHSIHISENSPSYVGSSQSAKITPEEQKIHKLPPAEELVVSQPPLPEEEVYEPKPLKDLVDLEAMPFQEQKPVYVLHNKEFKIEKLPHPYYVNFIDTQTTQRSTSNDNPALPTVSFQDTKPISSLEETVKELEKVELEIKRIVSEEQNKLQIKAKKERKIDIGQEKEFKAPTESELKPKRDWIPITETPPKLVFGPSNKPDSFEVTTKPGAINVGDVDKITDIASVSLTNAGQLAAEYKNRKETKEILPPVATQVSRKKTLPPPPPPPNFHHRPHFTNGKERSLGSFQLGTFGNNPYPGYYRENKVAPIFKLDPSGTERYQSRSIAQHPNAPRGYVTRHSRRINPNLTPNQPRSSSTQPKLVPGHPANRYMPLTKEKHHRNQYWWLPFLSSSLGEQQVGSPALIREGFFVENSHYDVTEDGERLINGEEGETKKPEIISKSKVEIVASKYAKFDSSKGAEEEGDGKVEIKLSDGLEKKATENKGIEVEPTKPFPTPISEDLAHTQDTLRIEPSLTTLSGDTITNLPLYE